MPETGSPCLELDLPEAAVQLVKFVDLTDEKVTVATRHLYKIKSFNPVVRTGTRILSRLAIQYFSLFKPFATWIPKQQCCGAGAGGAAII